MEVKLYKCSDDTKKCGKALSTAETKTINARGETIVVENPSFLVDYDEGLLLYNYCYIPKFKRYYFIEWQGEVAHRLRFSCNVDVLESFKTELKKRTMYILRQEKLFNKWYPDNLVPESTQINYFNRSFDMVQGLDSNYSYYITVNGGVH